MVLNKLASSIGLALLAVTATSSFADNQVIDLSSGHASFIGSAPLLDGGNDVLTFVNLAAGTYHFDFTLSSQFANISSVTVNGQLATLVSAGNYKFAGLSGTDATPFIVEILGTAGKKSLYSGELQVSAVPEPETYALMLAGLGAVGFVARRRKDVPSA